MSAQQLMEVAPTKHPGGRPKKFTPLALKRILRCARMGMPLSLCAQAVGVSGMGLTLHRRKHPEYEEALQSAIARGVARRLVKIQTAVEAGDWRAAAWWLEHCRPQDFAKNRLEITGANGAPLLGAVAIFLPQKQDGNGSPVVTVPTLAERTHGNGG